MHHVYDVYQHRQGSSNQNKLAAKENKTKKKIVEIGRPEKPLLNKMVSLPYF